jgi:flagellar biosynthesis activator protein FlaF
MPPSKSNPPNNPYAAGAGAYDQNAQAHTNDPRELEARVLLKAAKRLQALQADWDNRKAEELEEALRYNRNIWMMFVDTAVENKNGHAMEIRNNIANLGAFVCKHSLDILARQEKKKLDILIEINREIAAGLMTRPKGAQEEPPSGEAMQGTKFSAES